MIARLAAAGALVCMLARAAGADAETDYRDAAARQSIDALETIGARRPASPWTDNAWRTAAQLAERAQDYARAMRDLDQVIATTTDELVSRRARADRDRLATLVGDAGQWADVAARHDRLAERIERDGDPRSVLAELEALVRAHVGYPRRAMAMVLIARTWELEGESAQAARWLHDAIAAASTPLDRTRATAELARTLIRAGELAEARTIIAGIADRALARELRERVETAERRGTFRLTALAVVIGIIVLAAFAIRRAAGGWRAAAGALAKPPIEAVFVLPIAGLLAIVAQFGNPLVGHAVAAIAAVAVTIAWVSGTIVVARSGARSALVATAIGGIVAALASAYLALDWAGALDLVLETWRGGHALR